MFVYSVRSFVYLGALLLVCWPMQKLMAKDCKPFGVSVQAVAQDCVLFESFGGIDRCCAKCKGNAKEKWKSTVNSLLGPAWDSWILAADKDDDMGANCTGSNQGAQCSLSARPCRLGSEQVLLPDPKDHVFVRRFVASEMFVAIGNVLLKIRDEGGSGANMFALDTTLNSISGYDYAMGHQIFPAQIRDLDYINGYTFVSLADGRIVKVRETGGTGSNMFAITDSFESVQGYDYLVGDQKFGVGVSNLTHAEGQTLVSLDNGKMLKVADSGGTGHNMFNVTETTNGFVSDSQWTAYRIGDQKFPAYVRNVNYIHGNLFISLADGNLLKVKGTGGTGGNMFAIKSDFTSEANYDYRLGHQKFSVGISNLTFVEEYDWSPWLDRDDPSGTGDFEDRASHFSEGAGCAAPVGVECRTVGSNTDWTSSGETYECSTSAGGVCRKSDQSDNACDDYEVRFLCPANPSRGIIFVSLDDGKMIKIDDDGGTGSNMFNVTETASGFQISSGQWTNYRIGDQKFSTAVKDVDFIDGFLFVSLADGNMLKVNGLGGTGENMFAIKSDFSSVQGYNHRVGHQKFDEGISDVTQIGDVLFIGLRNSKILKIDGAGGTGSNMFNVTETANGFVSDSQLTIYRIGDQVF